MTDKNRKTHTHLTNMNYTVYIEIFPSFFWQKMKNYYCMKWLLYKKVTFLPMFIISLKLTSFSTL